MTIWGAGKPVEQLLVTAAVSANCELCRGQCPTGLVHRPAATTSGLRERGFADVDGRHRSQKGTQLMFAAGELEAQSGDGVAACATRVDGRGAGEPSDR